MTNPAEEAEAIRFGFDDVDRRSVAVLRQIAIAQINGWPFDAALAMALISIEQDNQSLLRRKAVLAATAAPQAPAWLAPDPLPVISAMQAKVALSRAGLLGAVQTWVNGQDAETQLIWATAPTFRRDSALVNAAAAALGIAGQLDGLWITAATIDP